jgi:hypothetical protein
MYTQIAFRPSHFAIEMSSYRHDDLIARLAFGQFRNRAVP